METPGPIIPEKRYSRNSKEILTAVFLMSAILVVVLILSLLIFGSGMGGNFIIGLLPYPIIIICIWAVVYTVNKKTKTLQQPEKLEKDLEMKKRSGSMYSRGFSIFVFVSFFLYQLYQYIRDSLMQ